ncbi:MAG: hypothetical protein CM15mP23_09130 [Cryomorphaceae bacterium]|nr:MAG: hypothetical protein CM15mP23_09130 [Cryomorphaceae bacterium]
MLIFKIILVYIYVYGCMDSEAFNYFENATVDDGSCIAAVYGCTSPNYEEYNPDANTMMVHVLLY